MAKIVRPEPLISEKIRISDAYELFLGSRKTQCTNKTYKIYHDFGHRHIIPSLVSLTDGFMEDVNAVVLRASINDYADDHGDGGRWFYYRHLKVFINWYWCEYDIETPNPMDKIKIKKNSTPPKQGITREDIDLLLKAAKNSVFPERDTPIKIISALS